MATYPKVDRLKQWLDTSGLKQTNMPLWQVISVLIDAVRLTQLATQEVAASSSGGGSGAGITSLNTDVVAVGPGAAVATIQPDAVTTLKILDNNVTYGKIQQVTGLRLIGNPDAPTADIVEIPLGNNLAFDAGSLIVEITPGVPGLLHRLLSTTHSDTTPAEPVIGDIIRAVGAGDNVGSYVHGVIMAPLVEDFAGVRAGYMYGMNGVDALPPIGGAMSPPVLDLVAQELPECYPTTEVVDAFFQSLIIEDFVGTYGAYNGLVPGQTEYGPGNQGGYTRIPLEMIASPDPENTGEATVWERLPVGDDGDVLTLVDGVPEWAPIPGAIGPMGPPGMDAYLEEREPSLPFGNIVYPVPGIWTSYTPTISFGITAIGDGSVAGRYMRIGKTVFYSIRLVIGTTTTFSGSLFVITSPSTIATASGRGRLLSGIVVDVSAGLVYGLTGNIWSSTQLYLVVTGTGAAVTDLVPITLANTDSIEMNGYYEEA